MERRAGPKFKRSLIESPAASAPQATKTEMQSVGVPGSAEDLASPGDRERKFIRALPTVDDYSMYEEGKHLRGD